MYNSIWSENKINPILSLFCVAEKPWWRQSVTISFFELVLEPKLSDPEISTISIMVNSRSSSNTFTWAVVTCCHVPINSTNIISILVLSYFKSHSTPLEGGVVFPEKI
jgi:hypothetical protein